MARRTAHTKILVIDDDPRMRDLIREIVGGPDVEVVESGDGVEVVHLYREHRPDWVILDLEMGSTDGISATRALQQEDAASRVVVLTKHDGAGFRKAAEAAGARVYLLKDHLAELKSLLLHCFSTENL